jgi:hypothetical protein
MGKVIAEKFVVTDNIGITRLTKNPQKITSDKEMIKTLHFLFNCRQIILFITFNNISGEARVFEDEVKHGFCTNHVLFLLFQDLFITNSILTIP